MIIRYDNLLLSLLWFLWSRISDLRDVSCLWFKSITCEVQHDWSLRGKSVTCMTYQSRPYKSVTSNSLLLEALCSMFGENNGESACKEKHHTRLDPARKVVGNVQYVYSHKLLPLICCEKGKEKTEINEWKSTNSGIVTCCITHPIFCCTEQVVDMEWSRLAVWRWPERDSRKYFSSR